MANNKIKNFFSEKKNVLYLNAIISASLTVVFAAFNGFLGVIAKSVWHGSICVYYLVLLLIRAIILLSENWVRKKPEQQRGDVRLKTFYITTVLSFVLNLALIAPVILMILNQKPVNIGQIPAIAIAAYTTYKIVVSAINYKKYRKSDNLAIRQIQTLNLVDAIVAVLTLQNTLIAVNSSTPTADNLLVLTATSSFAGVALILVIFIVSLLRVNRQQKLLKQSE